MYENEVSSAFEILLEEVETIIDKLNQEGARLFSRSAHREARQLLDKVEAANRFRTKIKELQKEWQALESGITRKSSAQLRQSRRKKEHRLLRGLRTPEEEFRIPILKALVNLGGTASADDVLKQVGKAMASVLNAYDKQRLASTPGFPRWRNTAQWTRNALVNEGLLSKNSPRGIWEITEAGRKAVGSSVKQIELPEPNSGNGNIPKVLYHVLRVYEYVSGGEYSYNEAVAKIAKDEKLKSIHTVYDACTRRIKLNTEQFRTLLESPDQLCNYLLGVFPDHQDHIQRVIMAERKPT
jgi:hypothetical protein